METLLDGDDTCGHPSITLLDMVGADATGCAYIYIDAHRALLDIQLCMSSCSVDDVRPEADRHLGPNSVCGLSFLVFSREKYLDCVM